MNQTVNNMTSGTHAFELAGLGSRPFRIVGTERSVFSIQGVEGSSRPGSSCDYCATAIVNVWWICGSGATDTRFKVGCDCVARVDPKLYAELQEYRRQERAALRAASHRANRAAAVAAAERRRMAQAERNETALAMLIDGALIVASSERCSSYERDLATRLVEALENGERDDATAQEWAVLSRAYALATAPESRHIGKPKERLRNVRARFLGGPIVGIDSVYGPRILAKFLLPSGEILVWPTSGFGRVEDGGAWLTTVGEWDHALGRRAAKAGDDVLLTGTVTDHDSYHGVAQTKIARCVLKVA